MLNILYFGDDNTNSTSEHRARALERLGNKVIIKNLNPLAKSFLGLSSLGPLHYHTGYRLLQKKVCKRVQHILNTTIKPDLIWVDSGELLGPTCLQMLKKIGCPLILYNVDDPTGKRDGHRFDSLLEALPLYNLVVVVRRETEDECKRLGAEQVMNVMRSYDELAHRPFLHLDDIPTEFRSEVAFIGTWMRHEKRDEFLLTLLDKGVPLSIWGDRWSKSPYWSILQTVYRGGALGGREYVGAIQGAKVCLGLLSKGNRDLHTQRSLEVPYAGGLLCAERTIEHLEMYQEGKEAVFWSDVNECAKVCLELLQDDSLREQIRLSGTQRVRIMHTGNEDVCRRILGVLSIS